MYRVEFDNHNPALTYVYEDTENATRCVMSVIRDVELARRVVEWLNTPVIEFKEDIKE